ncbi:MAG TPA: prepilin peptidase [Candidatus Portnoybacteria bacterium]|nr:prepilin peptidase [Candidatus Portnoybacteria bacterium]
MFYFLIFLFGASIGSFLNVVIDRLPTGKKLTGRSHCDFCGYQLKWFDLIPIFSFLWLKGACRRCHKKLSWQYPLVEILTGLIFALISWRVFNHLSIDSLSIFGELSLVYLFLITSLLIIISVIDWKTFLIPDNLIYFGIITTLIWQAFQVHFWNYLISAILVSAFFWALVIFSNEKWMGAGDAKLVFWLGLILGYPQILVALFISFFVGALVGLVMISFYKKGLKTQIPFGPFLCFSTLLVLIYQNLIMSLISTFF